MGFVSNITTGVGDFVPVVSTAANEFTHEPLIIVPIVGGMVLGYKISMKVYNKIKKA